MAISRRFYQDPWNSKKSWEVVRTVGSWYLRQYINGRPVSDGCYMKLGVIKSMGILSYKEIARNGFPGTC